jgi:ABC-type proline/glycine betaine transport system ATPase subunit
MFRRKKIKHFLEQKVTHLHQCCYNTVSCLTLLVQEALQLASSIAELQESKALSKTEKQHQTRVGGRRRTKLAK